MRKAWSRILSAFCVLGMLIFTLAVLSPNTVTAESVYGLTVICDSEKDGSIVGMDWKIYRVGERSGDSSITLTGDFAGYPVSTKNLSTTSAMQDAASTLANYASLDGLSPLASGTTNSNGTVRFEGLDAGIYLISGTTLTIGEKVTYTKYIPSPTLLEISGNGDETNFIIYPKLTEVRRRTESMATYTVAKVWDDSDNAASARPDSIVIELYCDGELDKEITLNEENDWQYTWEYDALPDWSIREKDVPSGYSVIYRDNQMQFVLVNAYNQLEDPTTPPVSSGVSQGSTEFTTTTTVSQNASGTELSTTEASSVPENPSGSQSTSQTGSQSSTEVNQPSSGTGKTSGSLSHNEYTTTTTSSLEENTYGKITTDSQGDSGSSNTTVNTNSTSSGGTGGSNNSNGGSGSGNGSSGGGASGGSSSTKLPQTGQLWWPVPILAAAGLIMIVIGTRLRSRIR